MKIYAFTQIQNKRVDAQIYTYTEGNLIYFYYKSMYWQTHAFLKLIYLLNSPNKHTQLYKFIYVYIDR